MSSVVVVHLSDRNEAVLVDDGVRCRTFWAS